MTNEEALTLRPGDHIRLRTSPIQPAAGRTGFTVARVEVRHGEADIISTDGFSFVPWEVEKVEPTVNH